MNSKTYDYKISDKKLIDAQGEGYISIYENDLKYKKYNNIDTKRIHEFDKSNNIDRDTVEYRFYECEKDGCKTLDLSHLNLNVFPSIGSFSSYIKYLFLSENKLTYMPDLSFMENLSVIDLCNNNLLSIPVLPISIEELLIMNNKVSNIGGLTQYPFLKRINCTNNLIKEIPIIDSVEILICENNKIEKISNKLPRLIKLMISNNQLRILPNYDNLKILEIENNPLESIDGSKNLTELYCNCTNINELGGFNKIEIIHCYKTNIKRLPYFNTLKELLCDYRPDMALSKYYKIIKSDVFDDVIVLINFK